MTKHIMVQSDDINVFKFKMDTESKKGNSFASQTHVTFNGEKLIYTGIIFCKD
jgi:hypothetical protein